MERAFYDRTARTATLTALGACAVALTLCVSAVGAQEPVETAYTAIKPSLVLVVNYHGKKVDGVGSGFVVGHHNGHMLIVTNRHVVEGGDGFLGVMQSPQKVSFGLTVVKLGTSDDLALLESTELDAPAVSLATTLPALGHAVSVAGYPRTQIEIAGGGGGLSPSVHAGNVNALPENGYYIEYDAQTDHGNSGGPLFDNTGVVYGIVDLGSERIQANFAIAAVRLRTFLANAGVFPSSSPPIATSQGQDDAPPIAPVPARAADSTVSVDHAACSGAMREFVEVLKQNLDSFDRYGEAQHAATEAFRVARDRQSIVGVSTLAAAELSAIQAIIRDEPKLSGFRERVAAAGAPATAQGLETVITDIATRDQDALQASLEKNYIIGVVLNGGTFEKVHGNLGTATTRMQSQVLHDLDDLTNLGICTR